MASLVATTATDMRAVLGDAVAGDSEKDTQMGEVAKLVSRAMEGPALLATPLSLFTDSELRSIPERRVRSALYLHRYPVSPSEPLELRCSWNGDFDGVDPLPENAYTLVNAATGFVRFHSPLRGPVFLRATYPAGFAADLSGLKTSYPDLAQAATLWAVQVYQRQSRIDRHSESRSGAAGTTVRYSGEVGAPPALVKTACANYRRGGL